MSFILNFFWDFLKYIGLASKEATIVFLGLDNAGKTTLLQKLKTGQLKQHNPTFHPQKEEFRIGSTTFSAHDLGGHLQARAIWMNYYPYVDAIVYIIDAADSDRLDESKKELHNLLKIEELKKTPFLILANKCDDAKNVGCDKILQTFELSELCTGKNHTPLNGIRPLEIFECSVLMDQGYQSGFEWLSRNI